MKVIRIIILCMIAVVIGNGTAQAQQQLSSQVRRYIRHGNKFFHTGQRDQATVEYMKAWQADSTSALVGYNLATSMFPNEWKTLSAGQCDTVVARFQQAAQAETNPLRRSMSYHNAGVALQSAGQLSQAIEAYKQCLRCNPHDDEARYNMVLCQRQLKDQPQQDNQGDNEQQDQQDQQQEQQQDQNQQQQQQDQPDQQPPQEQDQNWIEQMMNAAEQHERQVRRRLDEHQNQPSRRRRNEKNW